RRDIPLFVPLLCGWAVLLGRWTGQEDVVIGTRMPNRSSSQLERLIGPFENLIALRVRFDEHMTVNQLLRDVKTVIRKARSHQDMPLEEVLGECWLPPGQSRAPQVLMNVNTTPHEAIRCCDLTLQGLKITDVCIETLNSPFELSLSVDEGSEGLAGALEYASESFERETIDRLLEGWEVVLRQIVTDVHQQVVRMPIMKEEDANNIVVGFKRTDREYPLRKVIHELCEEQVRRKPEEVAAMHGKQALSYAELNDRANQLARYLRDVGIRPGDAVGIYAGRSLEMLIGVLGILKAGAAYLPLDPSYPADRLQLMIEDASPKAVLT